MKLGKGTRRTLIVDIDNEFHEALIRLGDHVPNYERNQFIQYTASILLMSLLMCDRDGAVDAFERITSLAHISDMKKHATIWGEFLALANYFHNHYYHHDELIRDLEDMMPKHPKEFPELIFEVEVADKGGYLKVS
jgi:hypothetical protein